MRRRTGVALLVLIGLVALAVLLTDGPVQGAKPPADVPLKATFRSLATDSVLNDIDDLPYETSNGGGMSVYFTGANGELVFSVDHHATRKVRVIFPDLPANATVGYLPDTDGRYGRTVEPVDFFKFRTWNSSGFAEPKVNFLRMTPGQTVPVRLWTTVCTMTRHYYFMNYSLDVGKISGVVQVSALDAVGNDGKVDTWVIEPLPDTNGVAKVYKQSESGQNVFYYFGDGPMPFQLTLEKK
jgi:hypothetical protein